MKKSKSFVKTLTRSYLLVSLLPLTLIMIFVFGTTIRNLKEDMQRENEAAAELITSQLNSLFENMSFLSIQITNNIMTNAKGLAYPNNSLVKAEQYYSQIQAECCSYAIVDSLYDVVFFSDDGYYITSEEYNVNFGPTYKLPEEEFTKLSWLEEVKGNYGKSILLPVNVGNVPLKEGGFLTLARAIRDPGKVVGYLCVQVKLEDVDEILKIGESEDVQIMLWDTDNQRALYSTENFPTEELEGKNFEEMLQNPNSSYLTIQEKGTNGIDIVLLSNRQAIYYRSLKTIGALCLEAFALLGLTLFFIKYYAEKMTKPLVALTDQMNRMTLDKLSEETGGERFAYEEIEYLYTGYEEMQKRLDLMIHKELASRTLQMQERLHSLQAQINPHFLYNTLNVIGIMGCDSNNQKIYDACLKLTSILRYSIADKNADISTIESELKNIKAYFELMKLRFEHRIEYDISCDVEIEDIEVPRLCLQPFVENMFEHAYDSQHKKIYAFINCRKIKNSIEIVIQDDGQGIDREALELMKETIRNRQNELNLGRAVDEVYGIGIENTILRMCLFFDGKFQYKLENAESGGFCVKMWIAAEEEQEDEKKNTGFDS